MISTVATAMTGTLRSSSLSKSNSGLTGGGLDNLDVTGIVLKYDRPVLIHILGFGYLRGASACDHVNSYTGLVSSLVHPFHFQPSLDFAREIDNTLGSHLLLKKK